MRNVFIKFIPFWIFLIIYKLGGSLHYSLISPLGERLLPLWIVGLLMGGSSIIQMLLDVPAGHFLDRFGYLKLLKLTTFIFLFAGIAFIFNFTIATYIISLIAATFGWVLFGPGVNAYILSQAPKKNSGTFISFRDIFGSAGVFLASAVLGLVLALTPTTIGTIIFAIMLAALAALYFSPPDTISVHHEQKLPTQHHYIRRNYPHKLLPILKKLNPASSMLLLTGLTSSIFYGVIWFVVPIVIANSANSGLLSIGLGIFDFAIVALGFLLGKMADKGNKRTLVFFGLLLFAVSGILIGFNFNWLFLVLGFLATTGDEMASISLWSWLHSLDKEHANDGLLSGAINLFQDLGWAIGPIISGFLFTLIGPSWTIMFSAVLLFATWIVYQFLIKQHRLSSTGIDIPKKPHRARHHV
ncbi:MAG: MFS transporter [Patescibacteria group bacterium]|jgi:MFS family permease